MNIAIILAGGTGQRMDSSNLPKQFIKIGEKEILIHTLEKFQKNHQIDEILIVMNSQWIEFTQNLLKSSHITKLKSIIQGGKTRQESSYNALCYIKNNYRNNDDNILILHDAVRPFVTDEIITLSIAKTIEHSACCVVVKTIDTIIKSKNNFLDEPLSRTSLYNEQTPQCFKFNIIWSAYNKAKEDNKLSEFTDDISFVHYIGYPVYLLEGNYSNIKITTNFDLIIAKQIYFELK